MLNVLEGQEEYSTVYIDDILIFFTVLGGPSHHITAVLEVLKRHGLPLSHPSVYGVQGL